MRRDDRLWRRLAVLLIASALTCVVASVCWGDPVVPPPLTAQLNPDHTITSPLPQGVTVLPGGIEWNPDGTVRFNWLDKDGNLFYAIYPNPGVTPWNVIVGSGVIPPVTRPTITTPSLLGGVRGTAYSQPLSATGGTLPYSWSMTGTVPGLSLSSQGLLAGTPTMAGNFPLSIQVADAKQQSDTKQYTMTVTDVPQPTVGLNVALIGPEPRVVRNLTPAQVAILTSRSLRNYLEANCEKDDDGITPAYRVLIRSNDNSQLGKRWQSILAKAPAEGCTIAAVNGDRYFLGPIPADTPAVMKILVDLTGVPADPIVPRDFQRLRIIPDGDWLKYNPPPGLDGVRIAVVDGERRYLSAKPRDLKRYPYGSAPGAKPLAAYGINLIPRSEWSARIAELKKANAGLMSLTYPIPPYDQAGTNYCWVNCVAQGMVALSYEQGRPLKLFSAASIGGPMTDYRNVGGWNADAVQFAMETGIVRSELWPSNAIDRSYFKKPAVQADYPCNTLTAQIADLGGTGKMFDEVATCVLVGAPVTVGYDWWGHAVVVVGLQIDNGKPYLILRNSWGQFEDNGFFLLPEGKGSNKGTPDDAQAILSMLAA